MAAGTQIGWTDATWPIVQGCDPVSPGCTHCYVPKLLWRMSHNPNPKVSGPIQGTVALDAKGRPQFTGKVVLRADRLDWPLAWRGAKHPVMGEGKPSTVFVPSHGDIFHEAVPSDFLDEIFSSMEAARWHIFQVLTKRAARMRAYVNRRWAGTKPPPNIWLMVSAEDQPRANARIPELLATKAAVRGVSLEPLLGPIDLTCVAKGPTSHVNALTAEWIFPDGAPDGLTVRKPECFRKLDWVIIGGESETAARARRHCIDWDRALIASCRAADVAVFEKQLGRRPYQVVDGRIEELLLKHKKGEDWDAWPADLRVREFPPLPGDMARPLAPLPLVSNNNDPHPAGCAGDPPHKSLRPGARKRGPGGEGKAEPGEAVS